MPCHLVGGRLHVVPRVKRGSRHLEIIKNKNICFLGPVMLQPDIRQLSLVERKAAPDFPRGGPARFFLRANFSPLSRHPNGRNPQEGATVGAMIEKGRAARRTYQRGKGRTKVAGASAEPSGMEFRRISLLSS